LRQLAPDECKSRLTNMLWLITGLFNAGNVHVSKIACQLPVRAKRASLDKRMRRFLSNPAVRVRAWYRQVAQDLLARASVTGAVHLVIDGSKIGFGHQLLMVGVAYKRRTLPIAWTWVRHRKGHSSTGKQLALLAYVRSLLPTNIVVSLVGDCEFGSARLIEHLDAWQWAYALRQPGHYLCMPHNTGRWQRLDTLLHLKPGVTLWMGRVLLTQANAYSTNLAIHWRKGEQAPWFLATNLLCPQPAIRLYRRRMWLEEMFGDMKGHGFDLEATHLRHFLRLSRLTLAVCLVYVWLVAAGEHVLATGHAGDVDRNDRRDLSIFRIGWDFVKRRCVLDDPIPIVFVPFFTLLSGG
jgi:hypothetical protein